MSFVHPGLCTSRISVSHPIFNNISENVRAKQTTARFSIRGPLNFPCFPPCFHHVTQNEFQCKNHREDITDDLEQFPQQTAGEISPHLLVNPNFQEPHHVITQFGPHWITGRRRFRGQWLCSKQTQIHNPSTKNPNSFLLHYYILKRGFVRKWSKMRYPIFRQTKPMIHVCVWWYYDDVSWAHNCGRFLVGLVPTCDPKSNRFSLRKNGSPISIWHLEKWPGVAFVVDGVADL